MKWISTDLLNLTESPSAIMLVKTTGFGVFTPFWSPRPNNMRRPDFCVVFRNIIAEDNTQLIVNTFKTAPLTKGVKVWSKSVFTSALSVADKLMKNVKFNQFKKQFNFNYLTWNEYHVETYVALYNTILSFHVVGSWVCDIRRVTYHLVLHKYGLNFFYE